VTTNQIDEMKERQKEIFMNLRTSALGIVDGFDFTDIALDSALGAYDGNVYENLFKEAKKSTLNESDVDSSFEKYLKPFLKSNL
jgi:acyl-CoA oxidase